MTGPAAEAPRRLVVNPVAWKDLLASARGPGPAARLAFPAIGLAVPLVVLAWCEVGLPGPWRAVGPWVFVVVAAVMTLLGLVVALPAATAFALERDRDTLEGLVVSPLSAGRLVTGKLLAALAVGAMTHAAALPALAMALLLGGGDPWFIPEFCAVLLAWTTSFAAFCILVGARRLEAPGARGWMRAQTTQAQIALQASLGAGILVSLGPLYGAALLPLGVVQGAPVGRVLDALAPLGGLHPMLAVLCWGDAEVLGLRAPVWLVGVVFHLLLALPLLADAAEAQRVEGTPPTRASRALTLPVVALALVLLGAAAGALPTAWRAAAGALVPAALLCAAAVRCGFVPPEQSPRVTRARLLAGLRPDLALESAPDRAPGWVLLLALLCAPFTLAVVDGVAAWRGLLAVGLAGTALAAVGARLVALGQEREERALAEAAARAAAGERPGAPDGEPAPDGDPAGGDPATGGGPPPRTLRGRFVARLLFLAALLPLLGAAGVSLGRGPLPGLAGAAPAFQALLTLGLAINPFAGALAVLADPQAMGTDAVVRALAAGGLDAGRIVGLHVGLAAAALAAAAATLRAPLDRAAALAALVAASRAATEVAPAAAGPSLPAAGPSPSAANPPPADSPGPGPVLPSSPAAEAPPQETPP